MKQKLQKVEELKRKLVSQQTVKASFIVVAEIAKIAIVLLLRYINKIELN